MGTRVRAGIVGSGFIGQVHAHAVRALGGDVVAVLGSSPESTQRAVAAMGARRGAASLEELVAAQDIDVVHVCTPNQTHPAMATAVVAEGKHVICEKPLATTVDEATQMTEAATTAGVLAFVPFVYRFYAAVREARARISNGDAGRLWFLHGSYLQDWLGAPEATNWRVDAGLGGPSRVFGDIGVHWCDLMEFTTGHRITQLTARTGTAYPDRRSPTGPRASTTDDAAVVLFETDRGAVGSLAISQATAGVKNRLSFSFDGQGATYRFDHDDADSLWIGGLRENRILARGPDTFGPEAAAYSRLPAGHPQGYQDAFNAFVADAYAAIEGGKPDGLPTFTDGLRAAILTASVVEATGASAWVEVPS